MSIDINDKGGDCWNNFSIDVKGPQVYPKVNQDFGGMN